MADYVKRTILCQAYLHIDDMDLSEDDLAEFARVIGEFTVLRGRHFFTESAEVDVLHKEGTEIFYITMTAAAGLYAAIAQYPSFREGVLMLGKDAYRFTEGLISEALFRLESRQFDAIRIESRAGVFMRLQNCIIGIEATGRRLHSGNIQSVERGIESVMKYCGITLSRIDGEEDRDYAREELRKLVLLNLPAALPAKRKSIKSAADMNKYASARAAIIKSLSVQ